MGCPMPLTTISIFKPGTTQELRYNESGEICVSGPGIMMGYDMPEATAKALMVHDDGTVWLHMGDMGYMDEEGHVFVLGRGSNNKRYGGGFVDILPMENLLADANIPGIEDQFFVNNPNIEHPGYLVPYLYVVLKDGYTVEDIRDEISRVLPAHMIPAEIIQLPTRPYWHFKTNRIGLTQPVCDNRRVCA
jgi:acyl-CoA synthetase (AMP-forming)/AMP-acid ligase II